MSVENLGQVTHFSHPGHIKIDVGRSEMNIRKLIGMTKNIPVFNNTKKTYILTSRGIKKMLTMRNDKCYKPE